MTLFLDTTTYVVVKNEIQVKIKFLSLNPTFSFIMNNYGQNTNEIENQTRLKLFLPEFNF